jgi:NAD dependent epimerase/dehydratase
LTLSNLVAVTGADGFIGSHLVEALVAIGHRVRAMVQYNSFSTWGWLDALPPSVMANVDVVPGDVRDPSSALAFVDGASIVYHLAALIAIPYSYAAPRSYLETNAGGTLNILEAARTHATPRLVVTSTSEVYGTAIRVPIDETHPVQAQSPYAASKIAADKLAESYHLSFSLPVVTLRPFNTFGPRQSARAVIPTIISQLAADRSAVRLGALTPTRDFTFVTDIAAAFIAVGDAPKDQVIGQVFNAGTGREIAIGDLAAAIAATMGRNLQVDEDQDRLRPQSSEVMRLVCNSDALRTKTGWGPLVTLEEGLATTAAWFDARDHVARYRPDRYGI